MQKAQRHGIYLKRKHPVPFSYNYQPIPKSLVNPDTRR